MTTLDDTPIPEQPVEAAPSPEYTEEVDAWLADAAASPRVRTQALGLKARTALDALRSQLAREQAIAHLEDEITRLRRGDA